MNISSNYDYSSQLSASQELLRLLQKRSTQDNSSAQELFQTSENTSQGVSGQKPASPLSALVSDGTITSDQEQAIKDALDAARMAYRTKTGAENASGNSSFKDPLASLVSAGTITEDQEAAVKSALGSMKKHHGMPPPPQMTQDESSDTLKSVLDGLTESGKITSDQQQYITSAFQSAMEAYSSQSSYAFPGSQLNSYEAGV